MRTEPGRYDRVEAHPEYPSAPREPVLPVDATIGLAIAVPFAIASTAGLLLLALLVFAWISPLLALIAAVAIAGVLILALRAGQAAFTYRGAPITRAVAVVVGIQADRVTLQLRDGGRLALYSWSSLLGRLAIDDIGVAYLKSGTLVEFIRFDVE
jgi:hypothetical protein